MATVAAGGKLSPSSNGPGTLTMDLGAGQLNIVSSITAAASASLLFDLGSASDELVLSNPLSALNIGLGLLELDDFVFTSSPDLAVGTYTLFDTGTPVLGTLGANVAGPVGSLYGELALGDGGNDVVLNVTSAPVPEPTGGIAAFVAATVCCLRRRR